MLLFDLASLHHFLQEFPEEFLPWTGCDCGLMTSGRGAYVCMGMRNLTYPSNTCQLKKITLDI